ncbi:HNH endonuclease [Plantibacter flavus]|uniref:HNH endonuclease signature motif containing protein n=1 Tax=Plantibacter flavus TaxID=150123 RepID=UPI003F14F9A3
MTSTAPNPLTAVAAGFGTVWAGALDPIRPGADISQQIENMNDEAVVRVLDALGAAQQALDVLAARITGSIALRSAPNRGADRLTRRAGYANAGVMVSERWRVNRGRGASIAEVGLAITPTRGFLGETEECAFPDIAAALDAAPEAPGDTSGCFPPRPALTVDAAAIILREVTSTARICSRDAVRAATGVAIEHSIGAPLHDVTRIAKLVRTRLDQDGLEPRDDLLRMSEHCTIRELPNGMTRLQADLAPENAAFVKAGLDALVSAAIRRPTFVDPDTLPAPDPAAGLPMPEGVSIRSIERRRAIALADVFRHTAGCRNAATDLAPVSIVVRLDKATLEHDLGAAHIDGIEEPIGAGAARRLAADARIIPMVLGGASQILDLGTGARLFSTAQKLALAERDGGCAWSGCTHPPNYTEAHHLKWWSRGGTTDLDNGILLCSFHHHRIHDDHWEIEVQNGVPWFTPPAIIDRTRTPIRGGRIRLAA